MRSSRSGSLWALDKRGEPIAVVAQHVVGLFELRVAGAGEQVGADRLGAKLGRGFGDRLLHLVGLVRRDHRRRGKIAEALEGVGHVAADRLTP